MQGPPEWVALAQQATFPPTKLPSLPPPPEPVPVEDGFDETAAGQAPRLATVCLDGSVDALEVTDEMAAAGDRCLKFVDAPNLQHVFNPHMFYTPHFREGRATLRVDLRREEGAVVAHEWRDGSQPYRVGPSIRIEPDGRLLAGGKHLLDVPVGTWFQMEIVCGLGKQADGTYDLKVTLPGREPREFNALACAGAQFKRLEWLGFVSLAADKTVFYLDNVTLRSSEAGDN